MFDSATLERIVLTLGPRGLVLLALVLALLVVVQTARLAFFRGAAGRRVARHRALGEAGERRAAALLDKAGYRIRERQVSGRYDFRVNDTPTTVHLRADFVVERGARVYVAEVKSGEEAAKISGRATRRQLLEYQLAFPVHGVLLVDTARGEINEVVFPHVAPATKARTTR